MMGHFIDAQKLLRLQSAEIYSQEILSVCEKSQWFRKSQSEVWGQSDAFNPCDRAIGLADGSIVK
jgi:hypothetical protein